MTPPVQEGSTALALKPTPQSNQLTVQGRQPTLADIALNACGLARSGCDGTLTNSFSEGDSVDDRRIEQMTQVIRKRGVKKRFEDDFDLKVGDGEDVPTDETEKQFLNRVILTLQKAEVKDIIKALDRVEKNNRQAATKDASFEVKQNQARAKVSRDEATELDEDAEFGTWHKGTPEEFGDEINSMWEQLGGEKDFSAYAGARVSFGTALESQGLDTLSGIALTKVQEALQYFHTNVSIAEKVVQVDGSSLCFLDVNSVKAELANWSAVQVVSAYRKLSLTKHPDKEGGSPEAFQQLTSHSKVLLEACGYHPSAKRGGNRKQVVSTRRSCVEKPAICVEFPENLRTAMLFFDLSEEDFQGGAAQIKKLRLRLGTLKDHKEKEIQREREPEKLAELLRTAENQSEEITVQGTIFAAKDLKQLKSSCTNLCRKHYTGLYTHIQKLK